MISPQVLWTLTPEEKKELEKTLGFILDINFSQFSLYTINILNLVFIGHSTVPDPEEAVGGAGIAFDYFFLFSILIQIAGASHFNSKIGKCLSAHFPDNRALMSIIKNQIIVHVLLLLWTLVVAISFSVIISMVLENEQSIYYAKRYMFFNIPTVTFYGLNESFKYMLLAFGHMKVIRFISAFQYVYHIGVGCFFFFYFQMGFDFQIFLYNSTHFFSMLFYIFSLVKNRKEFNISFSHGSTSPEKHQVLHDEVEMPIQLEENIQQNQEKQEKSPKNPGLREEETPTPFEEIQKQRQENSPLFKRTQEEARHSVQEGNGLKEHSSKALELKETKEKNDFSVEQIKFQSEIKFRSYLLASFYFKLGFLVDSIGYTSMTTVLGMLQNTPILAAQSSFISVLLFLIMPSVSIGIVGGSNVSQAFGKKDLRGLQFTWTCSFVLCTVYSSFLFLLLLFFSEQIGSIFVDSEEVVHQFTIAGHVYLAVLYLDVLQISFGQMIRCMNCEKFIIAVQVTFQLTLGISAGILLTFFVFRDIKGVWLGYGFGSFFAVFCILTKLQRIKLGF